MQSCFAIVILESDALDLVALTLRAAVCPTLSRSAGSPRFSAVARRAALSP